LTSEYLIFPWITRTGVCAGKTAYFPCTSVSINTFPKLKNARYLWENKGSSHRQGLPSYKNKTLWVNAQLNIVDFSVNVEQRLGSVQELQTNIDMVSDIPKTGEEPKMRHFFLH